MFSSQVYRLPDPASGCYHAAAGSDGEGSGSGEAASPATPIGSHRAVTGYAGERRQSVRLQLYLTRWSGAASAPSAHPRHLSASSSSPLVWGSSHQVITLGELGAARWTLLDCSTQRRCRAGAAAE